jgi:hypothetical protein
MKDRHKLGAALVACLADQPVERRQRALEGFDRTDVERLVTHASRHRVVPFLASAIAGAELPATDEVVRSIEGSRTAWMARHMLALAELERLQVSLDAANVPFVVVKGPVLSEHLYADAGLRMFGDVDLLFPPDGFARAVEVLERAGAAVLDRNWSLALSELRGQLHLQLPLGNVGDAHWHIVNRAVVREDFTIPTEELLGRARRIRVGTLQVPTLDPVDTLLHLSLHAALSGADRLIWLKDVERAIAVDRPPWDVVVRRSRRWKASRSVAVTLARARRTLDAPVPGDVLDALFASRTWRRIGDLLDRRFPVEETEVRQTPASFWAQLTRATTTTTLRAVAHRAGRRITSGADRARGPDRMFDPAGTPDDRQAFFQRVALQSNAATAPSSPR